MNYKGWVKEAPGEMTGDGLWQVEAYRLGLFAADVGWRDVTKLFQDGRTRALADQLYRALGSVSANVAEGYSRISGKISPPAPSGLPACAGMTKPLGLDVRSRSVIRPAISVPCGLSLMRMGLRGRIRRHLSNQPTRRPPGHPGCTFTKHPLLITSHVSRFTFHVSLFTFHFSLLTFHFSRNY
jgi:hypothetical protein